MTQTTFMRSLFALAGYALVAGAQQSAPPAGAPMGPPPGGMMGAGGPDRMALEQNIRERLGKALVQQLGLTSDQATKLQETNKRYDEKRRLLVDQERDIRMALRDLLIAGDKKDARTNEMLDRMLKVQRQRVDLQEQEQKELSGFLSADQRLRYIAVQDQMQRRMQQFREQQMQRAGGGRPGQLPGDPAERQRQMERARERAAQRQQLQRPPGPPPGF
ncbi:MAG: hypothetical protein K2X99_05745 [Gemmatimonadaceae bacterium]|nr:hypothetical protein [Gemmatimonadaceae bacterium]